MRHAIDHWATKQDQETERDKSQRENESRTHASPRLRDRRNPVSPVVCHQQQHDHDRKEDESTRHEEAEQDREGDGWRKPRGDLTSARCQDSANPRQPGAEATRQYHPERHDVSRLTPPDPEQCCQ